MFPHIYKIIRHSFGILITNPAAVGQISINSGIIKELLLCLKVSSPNTERWRNLLLLNCCLPTVFSQSLRSYSCCPLHHSSFGSVLWRSSGVGSFYTGRRSRLRWRKAARWWKRPRPLESRAILKREEEGDSMLIQDTKCDALVYAQFMT